MGPFQTLRDSVIFFFLGFPLIIISLVWFLAIGNGNWGLIVLGLGQIGVVPLAVFLSHLLKFIFPFLHKSMFVQSTHIAQLVPSAPYESHEMNVFPSYWVAQTSFFFAYIFTNAWDVYSMEPISDDASEEWRVNNRKGRSAMVMGVTVGILLLMVVLRYTLTGTETAAGSIWGLFAFSALGYGWYRVATLTGSRKGDILGIVQQMIPVAQDPNITMCTPPTA